ncbi:hypothetical protein FZI22_07930 [Cronobacter sakazakii]|nr:hypothetical protein FZI22_07930 [Cronobacter sakazakii]
MPVAIQQSPRVCTILVHYSVLTLKRALKLVSGGEKSPSEDGLKFPRQQKNIRGFHAVATT